MAASDDALPNGKESDAPAEDGILKSDEPLEEGGVIAPAEREVAVAAAASSKSPAITASPAASRPIEGGVIEREPREISSREPRVVKEYDPAGTAHYLTFVLLGIFAATILIHYVVLGAVLCFAPQGDTRFEHVERVFNTLLPVISGLVGTAVAYYFGQIRKDQK